VQGAAKRCRVAAVPVRARSPASPDPCRNGTADAHVQRKNDAGAGKTGCYNAALSDASEAHTLGRIRVLDDHLINRIAAGSSSGSTDIAVFDTGTTATSLSATVGGGTYFVRVLGQNACGTSAPSNEVVIAIP